MAKEGLLFVMRYVFFVLLCAYSLFDIRASIGDIPLKASPHDKATAEVFLREEASTGAISPDLWKSVQKHARALKAQGFTIVQGKRRCVRPRLSNDHPQKDKTPHENEGEILVFVSFSLPDKTLQRLADQMKAHNARLIIQGLHQDSFVKTKAKLDQLGITIDIDPTLFTKYQITRVPTFIQHTHKATKRISGNLTFSYVDEVFKEKKS